MNFIEEIIEEGDKSNLKFRFPPEPNGYLHLGHAKAICLNFGLAKKYNVECNLRFDDTNPIAEDSLYVNKIKEDIEWLGFKPSNIFYASDYFDLIKKYAIELIESGHAYMDDSTSDEIAAMKGDLENPGINSPYRNRLISENKEMFLDLLEGNSSGVLRAKIDMADPNLLLRDPVIYRRVNAKHHNTGDKYKAYPMYDFAHPISDWYEQISHSLCTLEFVQHRPFYNWLLEKLELPRQIPRQIEFSRLNVEDVRLSKRYLKELVDDGTVEGWEDPRMPTLKGLKRRGYTPESIKYFCEKIGITRKDSVIEKALLEECLREELNEKALRKMVVMDPIKLTVINFEGTGVATLENNPQDSNAGERSVTFTDQFWIENEDFREEANSKYHRLKIGGEVRLKGAFVVKAVDCRKDLDGNIIEVFCVHDPRSFSGMELDRKIKGTIHWVNRQEAELININFFEKMSKITKAAYAEPSVIENNEYPVQFIRHGYFIKDGEEFNHTVALKNSFKG